VQLGPTATTVVLRECETLEAGVNRLAAGLAAAPLARRPTIAVLGAEIIIGSDDIVCTAVASAPLAARVVLVTAAPDSPQAF